MYGLRGVFGARLGAVACICLSACTEAEPGRAQTDAAVALTDAGGKADEVEQLADARVSDPDVRVSDPDARVSDPDARVSDPDARVSDPDARVSEPETDAAPASERLCGDAWLEAARPLMADLYFLSESDYPLDPVLLADNLGAAVTPNDALGLFVGPAEPLVETREAAGFRDRLTLDFDPADPGSVALAAQFGALFAFLDPQLDAELVVRVSEVEVHVYYLGRTACGELAGFHTVSIET